MKVKVPELWDVEKHGPGTVVEWFKRAGEEVSENDLLCQIMVVKATHNIYSEQRGTLKQIIADTGKEVKPGDELAELSESEPVIEKLREEKKEKRTETVERIRATPSARRIARQKGVDLSVLKGTGKGGMITEQDVLSGTTRPGLPEKTTIRKITGVRKATAEAMMKSIHQSAQFTIHMYADVTDLVKIRNERLREMWISYNDLISFLTVRVLKEFPYMNAHIIENEEIHEYGHIHLGVSIQTEEGLYSAVVRNADHLGLVELSRAIDELIDKAKLKKITMDELTGSTFTVSNLGMVGVELFTPIINPPEVAILGVGTIRDHAVPSSNGISFRKKIGLSLTIDHRAVDGFTAAKFLMKLKDELEDPRDLL